MKQPIFRSALALAAVTLAALALIPLATARIGRQAAATATTVQVKGGEFFFRLSAKSAAKPGKVAFSFKNIGHVRHDFKINGKKTPLIQPGEDGKARRQLQEERHVPLSLHRARTRRGRNEGRLQGPLSTRQHALSTRSSHDWRTCN
jgi:hypothetical protein